MYGGDYDLIGGAGERAKARGLADATWYQCDIPRSVMKQLMRRTDMYAIRDTILWYAIILVAGALMYRAYGTSWAIPAFLLYATLYAGPADSRWHEAGHGTAFKTRWMNDWLYQVASFQVMRRPTVWRWSHARHHTDTLITGRDREIQIHLPIRILLVACDFLGLTLAPVEFAKAIGNAFGWISAEEKSFIPDTEWKRVIWEGRIWTLVFAAVICAALYWQTWLPLLFVGLPSVFGSWLYNFFGITQHACLPENVLDHRLNSRTVLMNPVFRFLYWNMNYHVEHHMFPMVPYHALSRLHDAIKADCPPPYPSTWAVYHEVLGALIRQWRDPSYYVRRPLPPPRPHAAAQSDQIAGVGQ
jgi:fatty acid desaturase